MDLRMRHGNEKIGLHTGETTVLLSGASFHIKAVEDIDYLLGLVKTDDDVPFWAVLWPAAVAMAEYIWENINFTGLRVLELGAGLGLTGIVAAARGADLVQTDYIPDALDLAQENARKNGINNITYVLGDWRNFPVGDRFDWIIGSDILYEPKLHPDLKRIMDRNLKPGGTVLLADPGRDDGTRFAEEMRRDGYALTTVTREVFDAGRRVRVALYFLRKDD